MNQIELPEGRPAESYHTGIQGESAIVAQSREIDCFNTILLCPPPPIAAFNCQPDSIAPRKSKIRRQHRHQVPAMCKSPRQGSYLEDGPATVLKRKVRLNCFQDAHTLWNG